MRVKELLENFLKLLQQEHKTLLESVKDYELAKALDEIREKKEDILQQLQKCNIDELKEHKDILTKIEILSDNNANIALNNMIYIEKMFEAIFEETKQYSKDGTITNQNKSIVNKKV